MCGLLQKSRNTKRFRQRKHTYTIYLFKVSISSSMPNKLANDIDRQTDRRLLWTALDYCSVQLKLPYDERHMTYEHDITQNRHYKISQLKDITIFNEHFIKIPSPNSEKRTEA